MFNMSRRTFHVSAAQAKVLQDGGDSMPFATISQAAAVALPGDVVLVHEGVYRELVNPVNGGTGSVSRIVYAAAPGEHPVIKGSEIVSGWERVDDSSVWHIAVPDSLFGAFNPFAAPLKGDWLERPSDWTMSLGEVYLDGTSMYEAPDLDAVRAAEPRTFGYGPGWAAETEPIADPGQTTWQWCSHIDGAKRVTDIWANFHDVDPNEHLTEINVRECCFYPSKRGVDYITVRGFEMAQAACGWAPPTGDQKGVLGTHWSRGWIIEDNDIHDARCSGISLGKDATSGDNEASAFGRKPGYQTQQEVVFRASRQGWSRETVGGHVVRRNHIHDCGQNGIVGHMGCAFSLIEDNDIHAIATKHEFFGHEIAGIKFHAAIDTVIRHNYIHDCTLGTWLDWQMQGTRVSSNVYHDNFRDFMIEVTSGPCLFDNNVFASLYSLDNVAQGSAFVHNLFCGTSQPRPVLNRSTPYHLPHSTMVAGYACVYGGDDRFHQNIFLGGPEFNGATRRGTAYADGAPTSEEEYMRRVHASDPGDVEMFEAVPQPMYIEGNAYLRGSDGTLAPSFDRELVKYEAATAGGRRNANEPLSPQAQGDDGSVAGCSVSLGYGENASQVRVVEESDGSVWLDADIDQGMLDMTTRLVDTRLLGMPRIVNQLYENPDGSPLAIDRDINGQERSVRPVVGPVEDLHAGYNHIRLV
jgi:hypothetical protein